MSIANANSLKHGNYPGFDSLDWSKEYRFQPIDQTDFNNKRKFLEQYYNSYWLANQVSGGFLVAQHGQIIFEGYSGFADIENEIPLTQQTPIHLASISKVLTGLAVLKLIEKNKLGLDDLVEKHFPDFPYPDITIENLLTHRSGLPNYIYVFDHKEFWDPENMVSNNDVLELFIREKPPHQGPPGKNFSYNNTNYVLLALIIEKATGMDYPKAMKEMVFDPLGMTDTFVFEYEKDVDRVSKSYYNNGRIWANNHLDKTYGDKNIYSTPRDLLKMDIAMYSDKFLSKELKEKAWKGYSYESKGVKNYGLGIRLMEWEDGQNFLYHTGWWHGNNTNYIRDYKNEAVIIALGNRRTRTIYTSFQLTNLFGDYPYETPEAKDSTSLEINDSILYLDKQIDSVKNLDNKLKTPKAIKDSIIVIEPETNPIELEETEDESENISSNESESSNSNDTEN